MKVILVVDDVLVNVQSVADVLRRHDFEVRTALSGAEAVDAVMAKTPDLILLDMQMPEMDGFVTCSTIRVNHPVLPILMHTPLPNRFSTKKAFEVGADGILTKPFDIDFLIPWIHRLLQVKAFHER